MNELKPIFHRGEQAMQARVGVSERMETFARKVIRDYLPDQHREFYTQLPYIFAGHTAEDGKVWASMIQGDKGFIQSPNDQHLSFQAQAFEGDPIADLLRPDFAKQHARIGLLGIELSTRRRNRVSAELVAANEKGFELKAIQTFGNCPQYIQTRDLRYIDKNIMPPSEVEHIDSLDETWQEYIAQTDTFFVASSNHEAKAEALGEVDGADVSHRGGQAGFIRVDDAHTLTIPDYLGNNQFATLGNFLVNPNAGLLFVDFERGHLLMLTGKAEVLMDSDEQTHFEGAERLWRFHLEEGRVLKNVLNLRWDFQDYAPTSLMTGTWQQAAARATVAAKAEDWFKARVSRIEQESAHIKSFYLEPEHGVVPEFKAGQFLTIKLEVDGQEHLRTYTVSSAPGDPYLRISVKREADGVVSQALHDQFSVDDHLTIKAPSGGFYLDSNEERPAILLSAGIGITPMLSMARHALKEGVRTRAHKPLYLFSSFRSGEERAFFKELNDFAEASAGTIQSVWSLTQPEPSLRPGRDYQSNRRIDKSLLQAVLPIDDYEVYLCGPAGFMQDMYDLVRSLGIPDERIYAEAFGPASLKRDKAETISESAEQTKAADAAVVEFSESKVEQLWAPEQGTLLEFAEQHGLAPNFACRNGQCGACKVSLLEGKAHYDEAPTAEVGPNEVLLCCAKPAAGSDDEAATLKIGI